MAIKTQASYFDGQTSTPHEVELYLDDVGLKLVFTAEDGVTISKSVYVIDYEVYNNEMKIRFKNDETHLVVADGIFINELEGLYNAKVRTSIYKVLIKLKFKIHILIALSVLSLIVAAYIFLTPVIAQKVVYLIPIAFDTQIGDMFMKSFIASVEIDPERTELLNEFAGKITWNSRADLNFFVVESDTINAFALPNGNIIVFTGLLDRIDDYEALLALLGHEVTHIVKRHSIQTMSKNLIGYALVSILTTDISALTAILVENAAMLGNLSYSRDMELEADNGAIMVLEENGVNPEGLSKLMKTLQDAAESSNLEIEILSTHPGMEKRIENINSKIKERNYKKNFELEGIFEKIRNKE
jgi:predicted Zn-dependent protease